MFAVDVVVDPSASTPTQDVVYFVTSGKATPANEFGNGGECINVTLCRFRACLDDNRYFINIAQTRLLIFAQTRIHAFILAGTAQAWVISVPH